MFRRPRAVPFTAVHGIRRILPLLLVLAVVAGATLTPAPAVAAGALPGLVDAIFPPGDPAPGGGTGTDTTTTPAPAPGPDVDRDGPCFGAAARDPERRCGGAQARSGVVPDPAGAKAAQEIQQCSETERSGLLKACWWGTPAGRAVRTVALLGDSHASHWRAAMQEVVTAKGWRGVSIQRAGCPLTAARPDLPGAERQQGCMEWNRQVRAWIAAHPRIDTVFTSAHLQAVIPPAGQTASAARRLGFTSTWKRFLRGAVRHVVVIRGTPRNSTGTLDCVEDAIRSGSASPGEDCALPLDYALRTDPLVAAARSLHSQQVQVADLHDFFCDTALCYPVVGGALVLRDVSHMTTTFSRSLGPYLLRRVDRLSAGWQPSAAPAP